jgi:transposase
MPQNWFSVSKTSTSKQEVIPMSIKRIYRRMSVKQVSTELLKERAIERGGAGTAVGLDVAKAEIVVVVRWADESCERPWSVKNPSEISSLIELLLMLKSVCDSLTIGLESTGNYSEAVRRTMTESFLEVHRVSGKAVADYKEIFDGVPSQHDGKDAAIIAELTAFGKGVAWPFEMLSEADQRMRHQVHRLDAFRTQANQWIGRLEGLLAKHWPEATSLLTLSSATLLKIILHYGSPAKLVADDAAAGKLRSWGRGNLTQSKIDAVIESARNTMGIPIGEFELTWLQEVASEVTTALGEVKTCEKRLRAIAARHAGMNRYVKQVGAVTLCVVWSTVGDPKKYTSGGAFLKALGLNLKEISSGKRNGELAISKRGPSAARKLLYYWALRGVQHPELRTWYAEFQKVGRAKSGASEHRKMKGLIAMMRKLCRSLWFVRAHDLEFDYAKVFPGEPLEQKKKSRRAEKRNRASVC